MMRASIPFVLLLCAGSAAAEKPWTFRCPAAGTVVRFEGGGSIRYGSSVAGRLICDVERQPVPWALGAVTTESAGGRALAVTTILGFFPAQPGARVRLPSDSPSAADAGELHFIGFEAVDLAGRSRQAAHVDIVYRQAPDRTEHVVLWLDQATGAPLRAIFDDTRNAMHLELRAVAIEAP